MICARGVGRGGPYRRARPMLGVVDDPAEMAAYGPRAVSPSDTVTCSSGSPSSSAAICAIAVRVPVPMSCIAVTTVARPSEPTRHPGVGRRPAASVPDLAARARRPDATSPRSGRAPRPAAPSAAPRAGSTRRDSWRSRAARRPGRRRVVALRSSSGSSSSLAASSSSRHSSPNVPSTNPGARNAAFGPVFSLAPAPSCARSRRRRASASARPSS